jgi:hypothetical protein
LITLNMIHYIIRREHAFAQLIEVLLEFFIDIIPPAALWPWV